MKTFTLMMLLLFTLAGHAQKENNFWYFGSKVAVDFNSGAAVSVADSKMYALEGSASISNAAGQLLFYSNGVRIWDRDHNLLPNGTNLDSDPSSSQACIFIPKPGSANIFYLFTISAVSGNGLRYSEINLALNGGLGDITSQKNILLHNSVCEKICAIKNSANNSYWVIAHGFDGNSFLAFEVSAMGVNPVPVVSNVGAYLMRNSNPSREYYETIGYMKISPDGSKIASANYFRNLELFDFDILTGKLTNPFVINTFPSKNCYGVEFSPSGNMLYVSTNNYMGTPSAILQYDLSATDIVGSETTISSNTLFGGLQLAPDCKIYCALKNSRDFYAINSPDMAGASCNLQSVLQLNRANTFGLPQFIQASICKKRTIANDDICLGAAATFSFVGEENITSASWNFGDGGTSNSLLGIHQYSAAGTYTVTGNFTTPTANFSITKQIIVRENPIANPVSDLIFCGTSTANYDLSQLNSRLLGNQSNEVYGVSFFATQNDALSHQNLLSPIQNFTAPGTTLYAKVYRLSNFDCYDITSFRIQFNAYPILNPVTEYKICDDGLSNDGYAIFDLNTKTPELLGTQSANNFKVSYHLSLADAQQNANPLPLSFTNTVNPQTLYARISTLPSETCYVTTSFNLNVRPSPEFDLKPYYVLCQDENYQNFVNVQVPDIFTSYLWAGGSQANFTNIATVGSYWVTVSKILNRFKCSRTKTFEVIGASKAVIKEIVTRDWTSGENSLQVLLDPVSMGEYEYSLDGINYQNSNFFEHLLPKAYTIYVREKNGCGITTDEVFLLMYPKFFTPNEDGYNDTWWIKFSETEPHLSVTIIDRYGKLISNSNVWDGKYQGKLLPADDYWFLVKRENGKEYRGHFTLKR